MTHLLATPVLTPPSGFSLTHADSTLLLGSCFTENMGLRLVDAGFSVCSNPFGILYNPLSMAQCLERCIDGTPFSEHDLVQNNGISHLWSHHGAFSSTDPHQCLEACNAALAEAHEFLKRCSCLVLTFGTAYVYRLRSNGRVVANCHKFPASNFDKQLASVNEIAEVWKAALAKLGAFSAHEIKVLFTVSPIRHWADTPHGNQLSKSTLMLAVEELMSDRAFYFPAYEVMMDELRDYRFYDRDMLHPSPLALDIIWERFSQFAFSSQTQEMNAKFEQLRRMKEHRPLFPESDEYRRHLQRISALEQELNNYKSTI